MNAASNTSATCCRPGTAMKKGLALPVSRGVGRGRGGREAEAIGKQ